MSVTTHGEVGASLSLCSNGAPALNSVTLKGLKAELVLLRVEMRRPYHVVSTKPQRLLQEIWEAQGVSFALEGAFVPCLSQGMGTQSCPLQNNPLQQDSRLWPLHAFPGGSPHADTWE